MKKLIIFNMMSLDGHFAGLTDRQRLKLVSSRVFRSGNVLLIYQPQ